MARNSTKRLGVLVFAVAIVGGFLAACGSTEPRNLLDSIRDGNVVLGVKFDQPGLGLYDPETGGVDGFDADVSTYVVNAIADQLGVDHPKITWRETPSARREAMIENGEVDMIAATYSINAARSKKVDFGGPYLTTYQGLLVREDDDSINTLTDLNKGKKLCSVSGSTSAQNVKAQLPSVQLQEYDTYSACVEGLRRGKVDALTTDEAILAGYNNFWGEQFKLVEMTYPKAACVTSSGKKVLKKAGAPFSTERYGIGLGKGDTASQEAINAALDKMLTPEAGGTSPWTKALQDNLGTSYVDMIATRAERNDSFSYKPDPGNLEFLDSPSTPCPADLQ
ncbi:MULTISPECIES: glutamate ABC transporter substrate-binding protein [unclassified Gordonia (in: high G+C Gram-positive bacteria)]|uniref:glutamate ABC transporter substrate-binding protein n=1 Tax=unclassified Gordonia (in: high G+C Gram-positive bacteria) TaxID=2657482 RepID=UPI001F113FDB|nr:glutamate ABC transporter substrate-binding protein [Gordonia sp. ABSL49_1]MCH5642480.1 glutamate ABC transporter substrate-binding protein [Gordonia sp. ABSL49_1]